MFQRNSERRWRKMKNLLNRWSFYTFFESRSWWHLAI